MGFHKALSGRPGPVYIDLPLDVLREEIEEIEVRPAIRAAAPARPQGDPLLIEQAAELLLNAERPLLIVGKGIRWAGDDAFGDLRQLVEDLGVPFLSFPHGTRLHPGRPPAQRRRRPQPGDTRSRRGGGAGGAAQLDVPDGTGLRCRREADPGGHRGGGDRHPARRRSRHRRRRRPRAAAAQRGARRPHGRPRRGARRVALAAGAARHPREERGATRADARVRQGCRSRTTG